MHIEDNEYSNTGFKAYNPLWAVLWTVVTVTILLVIKG